MKKAKWRQISKRVWKINLDITRGKIVQKNAKGNWFWATSYKLAHGNFDTIEEAMDAIEQYENEMLFILGEKRKTLMDKGIAETRIKYIIKVMSEYLDSIHTSSGIEGHAIWKEDLEEIAGRIL